MALLIDKFLKKKDNIGGVQPSGGSRELLIDRFITQKRDDPIKVEEKKPLFERIKAGAKSLFTKKEEEKKEEPKQRNRALDFLAGIGTMGVRPPPVEGDGDRDVFVKDILAGVSNAAKGTIDLVTGLLETVENQQKKNVNLIKDPEERKKAMEASFPTDARASKATRDFSKKIKRWSEEMSPENPDFADQLMQGVGSMGLFAAANVVTGGSAIVPVILESMGEAGSVYEENREAGLSIEESGERASYALGFNLVLNKMLNVFDIPKKEIKTIIRVIRGAGTEAVQEGSQQIISNVYTDRPVLDGVLESMGVGAILGGGTTMIISSTDGGPADKEYTRRKEEAKFEPNVIVKKESRIVETEEGAVKDEEVKKLEPLSEDAKKFEDAAIKDFGITKSSQGSLYITTDGKFLKTPRGVEGHADAYQSVFGVPAAKPSELAVRSGMTEIVDNGKELNARFYNKPTQSQIDAIKTIEPNRERVFVETFDVSGNIINSFDKKNINDFFQSEKDVKLVTKVQTVVSKELTSLAERAKTAKSSADFVADAIFTTSLSGIETKALEKFEGKTVSDKLTTFFNQAPKTQPLPEGKPSKKKPTKKVAPKKEPTKKKKKPKKVIRVPEEQLPVGIGREKVSRLETRLKGTLDNTQQEQIDELGLSTFNQMSQKNQVEKAMEYALNNQDDALRVVSGEIAPPKGILKNSVFGALVKLGSENTNLATKIATMQATRFGQEINILQTIMEDEPVVMMQDIVDVRIEAYEKRTGKKATEKVKKEINKINKEEVSIDKSQWDSFLNNIKC